MSKLRSSIYICKFSLPPFAPVPIISTAQMRSGWIPIPSCCPMPSEAIKQSPETSMPFWRANCWELRAMREGIMMGWMHSTTRGHRLKERLWLVLSWCLCSDLISSKALSPQFHPHLVLSRQRSLILTLHPTKDVSRFEPIFHFLLLSLRAIR